MRISIFLISVALLLSACKEKSPEPSQNPNDKADSSPWISKVWSHPHDTGFICMFTGITQSYVVYVVIENTSNNRDRILVKDKTSGKLIWSNNQFGGTRDYVLTENQLVFFSGETIIAVDINDGKTLWEFKPKQSRFNMFSDMEIFENHIYAFALMGNHLASNDSSLFYKIDLTSGLAENIITLKTADYNGHQQDPRGMVFYRKDGKLMCFVQGGGHNWGDLNQEIQNFLIIDVENGSVHRDLGNPLESKYSGAPPILQNNFIYFHNGWDKIGAYNLQLDSIVWITTISAGRATGAESLAVANDLLYLGPGNKGILNVLDLNNGSATCFQKQVGSTFVGSNLTPNNNNIYFTTAKGLYRVSTDCTIFDLIETDQIVDFTVGSFDEGLAIENNLIYTTRGYDFTCFEITK